MFKWMRVGLTRGGTPIPEGAGLLRFTVSVGDIFCGEVNNYVEADPPYQATWIGLFSVVQAPMPDTCWNASWDRNDAMSWVEGKIRERLREMDDAKSHPISRSIEESIPEVENVRMAANAPERGRRRAGIPPDPV